MMYLASSGTPLRIKSSTRIWKRVSEAVARSPPLRCALFVGTDAPNIGRFVCFCLCVCVCAAKILHPDVRLQEAESDGVTGSFEALREAYDVLSDANKRGNYDSQLKEAFMDGRAPPSHSAPIRREHESIKAYQENAEKLKMRHSEQGKAMPMWYVGQEKPSEHQVYYYKQGVAMERNLDK